jgi:hypothetical protein
MHASALCPFDLSIRGIRILFFLVSPMIGRLQRVDMSVCFKDAVFVDIFDLKPRDGLQLLSE